ncbi:MAG: thiamine-phosphate kinase, partial [Oceanococcus sp.]
MNEFELIQRYFHRPSDAEWLSLGIGDDAAVLRPEAGFDLVVCSDTLIAGRHFPRHTSARDIGWKALAVNLSDLAAMGATPRGFLLNLTLPEVDETFLQGFSEGLFQMADHAGAVLLGGDTTRGNLSISITALGQVRSGKALKRSGAQAQDRIVLVGDLGGAALALQQGEAAAAGLKRRLNRPKPFVAEG